jgi:hypothetical protein
VRRPSHRRVTTRRYEPAAGVSRVAIETEARASRAAVAADRRCVVPFDNATSTRVPRADDVRRAWQVTTVWWCVVDSAQVTPATPCPAGPRAPVALVAPVAPVGPVAPVAPVAPVTEGPGGPCGPARADDAVNRQRAGDDRAIVSGGVAMVDRERAVAALSVVGHDHDVGQDGLQLRARRAATGSGSYTIGFGQSTRRVRLRSNDRHNRRDNLSGGPNRRPRRRRQRRGVETIDAAGTAADLPFYPIVAC